MIGRSAKRLLRRGARGYHETAASCVAMSEPFQVRPGHEPRVASSAVDAIAEAVRPGTRVFVGTAAGTPVALTKALAEHGHTLRGKGDKVEVTHIHTEGGGEYMHPDLADVFKVRNFFTGPNARAAIAGGTAQYAPMFLSEIPLLFRRGYLPLDVALITVSPPDRHGYASLGVSVDVVRSAIQCAKTTIAVINPNMPRTFGDGQVHVSQLDVVLHSDDAIPTLPERRPSEQEHDIGRIISEELVRDGATLQMGIGAIPDAVLSQLGGHRDLGVHSEMFSDGIIDLVEAGVITNAKKAINAGQLVGGFCVGSRRLYDFLDDNTLVRMRDIAFVNDTTVIRQQPGMTAINSAIEVDLTGQVVSDSIGERIFSGVGGQLDFIRGASLCPDGVPIIALPSVTRKGETRIVPTIRDGGGVVTTRAHVHNIVTEFGAVDLFGKTLQERARALISISHPDHREALERAAHDRLKHLD